MLRFKEWCHKNKYECFSLIFLNSFSSLSKQSLWNPNFILLGIILIALRQLLHKFRFLCWRYFVLKTEWFNQFLSMLHFNFKSNEISDIVWKDAEHYSLVIWIIILCILKSFVLFFLQLRKHGFDLRIVSDLVFDWLEKSRNSSLHLLLLNLLHSVRSFKFKLFSDISLSHMNVLFDLLLNDIC